jgi:hypothetical protein
MRCARPPWLTTHAIPCDKKHVRTVLKSAAFQLALAAMLLRAVLPAGWMPAPVTGANASPFVICSIDGPQHSPPGRQKSGDDIDHSHGAPCVFASAAHLAPAVDATPAPLALNIAFVAYDVRAEPAPLETLLSPHAARGPPAFA